MVLWETIFQLPISGSITNGVHVKLVTKNGYKLLVPVIVQCKNGLETAKVSLNKKELALFLQPMGLTGTIHEEGESRRLTLSMMEDMLYYFLIFEQEINGSIQEIKIPRDHLRILRELLEHVAFIQNLGKINTQFIHEILESHSSNTDEARIFFGKLFGILGKAEAEEGDGTIMNYRNCIKFFLM